MNRIFSFDTRCSLSEGDEFSTEFFLLSNKRSDLFPGDSQLFLKLFPFILVPLQLVLDYLVVLREKLRL